MARRGWPVWTAIVLLLSATLVLSACARPGAPLLMPGQAGAGSASPGSAPLRTPTSEILDAYGLPLHFEENHGQADRSVRFAARTEGGPVGLTPEGLVLGMEAGTVRLTFVKATAVAVDAVGNAYVAGAGITDPPAATSSPPFPITATLTPSGSQEGGYVVKLDTSGVPTQAAVIGPTPKSIDVGSDGTAYVAGAATDDFATANAFQPAPPGGTDGFAARLNAAGTGYVWSTYVGGSGGDAVNGIAVDAGHNAWLVGTSSKRGGRR